MSALSSKLRSTEDNGLMFWCPGCNDAHRIQHGDGTGPRWGWNGNAEMPTFTPSVLVRTGHYVPGHEHKETCWCTYNAEHPGDPAPFLCAVCHSFVTDGQIQFLGDCTHALAGQTVPLPDYPGSEE
jgi:hypothetical protein